MTRQELEARLEAEVKAKRYWHAAVTLELLHTDEEEESFIDNAISIHEQSREWVADALSDILGDKFLERL